MQKSSIYIVSVTKLIATHYKISLEEAGCVLAMAGSILNVNQKLVNKIKEAFLKIN